MQRSLLLRRSNGGFLVFWAAREATVLKELFCKNDFEFYALSEFPAIQTEELLRENPFICDSSVLCGLHILAITGETIFICEKSEKTDVGEGYGVIVGKRS